MPFDPKFTFDVLLKLAVAAYESDPINLDLPEGFSVVGPLIPEYVQASDVLARMLEDSGVFGYVFKDGKGTAVIAIRGTRVKAIRDWLIDFDAVLASYPFSENSGSVHLGALSVYEALRNSIFKQVFAAGEIDKLYLIGHSLGAQISMVAGPDLRANCTPDITLEMVNFAGPRAGDHSFHSKFVESAIECYRVVNFPCDIVPELPTPPVFEHVGTEIKVYGGIADPIRAHGLTTGYAPGLERLV
jgi:predicted lipase